MTIPPQMERQNSWPSAQARAFSFQKISRLTQNVKPGRWLAGGVLILVLAVFWLLNHRGGDASRGPRMTAVPVHVASVTRRDMAVIERTIGTVIANNTVQVTPQVQGRVEAAFFKEGQMVKKGDLLFQIDPRPFEAVVAQTRGQLAKDQAALDGARRDLKRFQALLAVNAASEQVVDDQMAAVAADQGNIEADKANLQTAQINLGYAQIRSPINGKTGPITIMPGNIISVTGTTTNVNPLVTITEIEPVKISFFLPQTDLPRIQARMRNGGLTATVNQSDVGGANFTVSVNFVSNTVDGPTGTIELRTAYDNKDQSLVPGQLVNIVVELSQVPNATVVPHDALTAGPTSQYVYRIKDGKAEEVPVTVLFDDSENAAVAGGLAHGDQVVVRGQLDLVPGGAVDIVRGEQGAAAGGRRKKQD